MFVETNTFVEKSSIKTSPPNLSVRRLFIEGGIPLGIATVVQRLCAFVSTALIARIGGIAILGEYSIALSTAGVVGAFVGTGVGTVALRYAGQFSRNTLAYRKVLRVILTIAGVAAFGAGLLVFVSSAPLARLVLNNERLRVTLEFAAIAVIGVILFEALNGLLVALHDFRSLLWLSAVSGVLIVLAIPYASQASASLMLVCYALALLGGITAALINARESIRPLSPSGLAEPTPPRAREIILFGNIQQFNTIVIGVASWWVIVLVTRYDPTLHQIGFYVVGSQLRQLAGQGPTLASQLVFPTLSRLTALPEQHDRVLSISTFVCAALSFIPAGVMLIVLPWILKLYGTEYQTAVITSAILVATAVVQLSYVPAANALMMLSLRASAFFSIIWSVALVLLASTLIKQHGAQGAALGWLFSQLASQVVLLYLMKRMRRLPAGTLTTWGLADLGVLSLTGLAFLRALNPGSAITLTSVQILAFIAFLFAFLRISQARDYLPRDTRALLLICKSAPAILFSSLLSPRRVES